MPSSTPRAASAQYIPVPPDNVIPGLPVLCPVFDANQNLLLNAGIVVASEKQATLLRRRGYVSYACWAARSTPSTGRLPPVSDSAAAHKKIIGAFRFDLNDVLHIHVETPSPGKVFTVGIQGVIPEIAIITACPPELLALGASALPLRVTVQGFSGRVAFVFTTQIESVRDLPAPHIFIAYPAQINAVRVRETLRAPVDIYVAVEGASAEPRAARLADISARGARIVAETPIGIVGDTVTLSFKVITHQHEVLMRLQGSIQSVYVQSPGGVAQYSYGVRFLKLAYSQSLVLTSLVYQQLLEPTLRLEPAKEQQ